MPVPTQAPSIEPAQSSEEKSQFELIVKHGHKDLVQAVAFNGYGDRVATGSVDGKINVFNRHRDGLWKLSDTWTGHAGEVLELQWLPPTVYPKLLASLGMEGNFKLWLEEPSAPPGRRFSSRVRDATAKAAFEHRSGRAPYRHFSIKYDDETRHTFLALISADGRLSVFENEMAENLSDYAFLDEFYVCEKPARGEEIAFRVRFDPNPQVCYKAIRAGIEPDTLGLVVACMDKVKVFRTRGINKRSWGLSGASRRFYKVSEITGHRGLVRDVAWAPGNFRGYDMIATACTDGFVRVVRMDTPYDERDGKTWSSKDMTRPSREDKDTTSNTQQTSAIGAALASQAVELVEKRNLEKDSIWDVKHVCREISKLDNARTPVWRVGFDDDGAVLGSAGDDGKLHCYRQTPDGRWLKSSEVGIARMKMTVPT